jgi:hypothetical protein
VSSFLAGVANVCSRAGEPGSAKRDDVELWVGGLTDSRPEPCPFLIVLPFFDPNRKSPGFEVEKQITHIELDELGDSKGTHCAQGDDGSVPKVAKGSTRSGQDGFEMRGSDGELVCSWHTADSFEGLGPSLDFPLVVGKGELES